MCFKVRLLLDNCLMDAETDAYCSMVDFLGEG